MIPNKLNYSIELDTENFSISVSEKLHPLVKTYIFKMDDRNYMVHVYPGDKVVVTTSKDGSTTILSNAKLTKIDEKSVAADI